MAEGLSYLFVAVPVADACGGLLVGIRVESAQPLFRLGETLARES